ncbi:MAG: protein kinase [Myxococcota bacterium]
MAELGDTLGRYTLLKRLATGGMGEIYLAARMGPLGFAPPVALKVLRDEFASDSQFIDMLVDEAKISMFLNHQNVVSVLDFGEEAGRYYIAMEYVQGVTLKHLIDAHKARQRKMDIAIALYVMGELCRALKYAHTRTNHAGEPLNIVHRDVTPGNVLLSIQGEVKLTDFGIARAKNRVHQTQAGVLKGKFGYMAPEMLRYEQIDSRADLFCAAVMLYEMVAGQHPVEGAAIMEAIQRLEEKDVRPPSSWNNKISKALDAIVMKGLEPKPIERWPNAAAFGGALQDLALSDGEIRPRIRNGAEHLGQIIRELFPETLEAPLPREQAEHLFAIARERSSVAPPPRPDSKSGITQEESIENLVGRDVSTTSDDNQHVVLDSSGMPPRSQLESASREWGEDEPSQATVIPTSGRSSARPANQRTASAASGARDAVEVDTDEHDRDVLKNAAKSRIPDNATMSFNNPLLAQAETGEVVIRFPETSTDRAHLHEQMIEEPSLPQSDATLPLEALTRKQIERAHANERTIAQPDAFGSPERADDSKTIATGMPVPDWASLRGEAMPSVQVIEPPEEEARAYDEDELPAHPVARDPSYDDGKTAYEDRGLARGEDVPTMIPSEYAKHNGSAPKDDTLLDSLSLEDIEREKAAAKKKSVILQPEEEEFEATRHRPDPSKDPGKDPAAWGADFALEQSLGSAKKVSGPLRIRMNQEGGGALVDSKEAPAPHVAKEKSRTPQKTGQPVQASGVSVGGATVEPVDPAKIGNATGKWIRGELGGEELGWGDDEAARRLLATRHLVGNAAAPPGPPPPADPRRTNAGVPRPLGAGGVPMGTPVPAGLAVGPPMGVPAGVAQPGQYPPGFVPPPQPQAARISTAMAGILVAVAVAISIAAVLFSKVAWPSVTFDSKPPGASMVLDGLPLEGKTPVGTRVKPNVPHWIEVKLPGYKTRRIDSGLEFPYLATRTLDIQLEKVTHKIRVSPVEGRVFVNDVQIGAGVEVELGDLLAQSEPITLRIEADGYISRSETFTTRDAVPALFDVPLTAQK